MNLELVVRQKNSCFKNKIDLPIFPVSNGRFDFLTQKTRHITSNTQIPYPNHIKQLTRMIMFKKLSLSGCTG